MFEIIGQVVTGLILGALLLIVLEMSASYVAIYLGLHRWNRETGKMNRWPWHRFFAAAFYSTIKFQGDYYISGDKEKLYLDVRIPSKPWEEED